jgi:hypothetical protein
MQRYHKSLLLMGTCCLLFSIAGCNESVIKSIWRQADQNNTISISDDSRPMIYFEEQKIGVGFQNDADNLYIMLKTSDRGMQQKVMRAGLTIWLDSKGKKNKAFGVHFPLGMQAFRNSMRGERSPEEGSDEPRRHFAARMDTLEILGPSKDERHRIPRENGLGIVATFSDTTGWMDYELTIPLKAANESPYTLVAKPGDIIGIGFETAKINMPQMSGPPDSSERMPGGGHEPGGEGGGGFPGGAGGGGFPGARGGHQGGRGGMSHGERGESMSGPLKLWTKVILVSPGAKGE